MTFEPYFPAKIVSGGQTGADQSALAFAISKQIPHGGWCPRGRRSEDGPIPDRYQLQETPEWGYRSRTEWNVRDSDATVIFNPLPRLSPGSAMTLRACEKHGRPFLLLRDGHETDCNGDELARWLARYRPSTLNVAGHRDVMCDTIGIIVVNALERALNIARGIVAMPATPEISTETDSSIQKPRQMRLL